MKNESVQNLENFVTAFIEYFKEDLAKDTKPFHSGYHSWNPY